MPDIEVVNQDGQHLRFNSQVVDGRIAIVTGFFTTCSSMCPITQEKLSQVAKLLGPRLGKDVVIVSVSVDAENDTPARMKDWAEKFHTGPGWTLLSGNRAQVDTLLKSLGLFVELRQRHQSALMIGNAATGWVRISSWTPSEKLAKLAETMSSAKPAASADTDSSAASSSLSVAAMVPSLHKAESAGPTWKVVDSKLMKPRDK